MKAKMKQRPISPHIQIYKWHLSMFTSICHRISGLALSGGLLLLIGAAIIIGQGGSDGYEYIRGLGATIVGQAVIFLITLAFAFHVCNGVRHLLWDILIGLELPQAKLSGQITLVMTIVLSIIIFLFGHNLI